MSKQQEPKKPRPVKSRRLKINSKDRRERLLNEVNKDRVPISVLQCITVNLKDGTSVDIDVEELLEEGADPEVIEIIISEKLEELDDIIRDVDFHINIRSVANVVQPFTDNLLKNL